MVCVGEEVSVGWVPGQVGMNPAEGSTLSFLGFCSHSGRSQHRALWLLCSHAAISLCEVFA